MQSSLQRIWPSQQQRLLQNLCFVQSRSCRRSAVLAKAGRKNGEKGASPKQVVKELPTTTISAPKLDSSDNLSVQTGSPEPDVTRTSLSSTATLDVKQGLNLQLLWRRLLIDLSSLPRAIALMAATFGFSALGTVIPQNKAFDYYIQNYPEEGEKVLGFLTYKLVFLFELDHIYTAWYFYLTLAWLAASLMACTSTRQWPAVKVAQRWRFQTTPVSVTKQGAEGKGIAEVLPAARLTDLGSQLTAKGYQVFLKGPSLYAFKGLAGKLGPIGVHVALLLVLAGTSYSGFGGFKGTVMMPEGQEFLVSDVLQAVSPLASPPPGANKVVHVNKFSIDYRPDGSVAQFYSDLSMLDPAEAPTSAQIASAVSSQSSSDGGIVMPSGLEMLRKTISVNDPFRFGGITMYQTDWALSGVQIRVVDSSQEQASQQAPLQGTSVTLPMASLEGKPGINGRLWATYLPVAAPTEEELQQGRAPRGVSILARDPQSVVFYDTKGEFVGVRRPESGKPIEVEGVQLVVERVIGATGLELKNDPGVPLVYAGFGGLMVTTLISYLSHSQVWALQEGSNVYVSGRTNRAKLAFEKEMNEVLEAVPEYK